MKCPLLFAFVLLAGTLRAQTANYDDRARAIAGVSGGNSFGNLFFSTGIGVEIPVAGRFEIDAADSFSPLEEHLGRGWANQISAGGIVWNENIGFDGAVDYSNYSTSIAKGGYYAQGGVAWRRYAWGKPVRFSFDYFRQFRNGVSPNGTETDHVQGGTFTIQSRLGAAGPVTIRTVLSISAGHLLTQGNPACDGSRGVYLPSCKRAGAVSGGGSFGIYFEFPRHRGYEESVF